MKNLEEALDLREVFSRSQASTPPPPPPTPPPPRTLHLRIRRPSLDRRERILRPWLWNSLGKWLIDSYEVSIQLCWTISTSSSSLQSDWLVSLSCWAHILWQAGIALLTKNKTIRSSEMVVFCPRCVSDWGKTSKRKKCFNSGIARHFFWPINSP